MKLTGPPVVRAKVPFKLVTIGAVVCLASWLFVENHITRFAHPRFQEMLVAAQTMQRATLVIREEKDKLGLLQPPNVDPNRTGLIGPEWSELATTLGALEAKRTATNPDLAAALVGLIASILPPDGDASVVVIVSGSFVGGNLAALAAVQALDLKTVLVSSQGASTFGATDLEFTWLDMEALLNERGIIRTHSILATLGGDRGVGANMFPEGRKAAEDAAAAHGVPVLGADSLATLTDLVEESILEATGGLDKVFLVVNVGGSAVALGDCPEADRIPSGLITERLPCSARHPGLIGRFASAGIPVINVLDLRRLTVELGLPYDPIPLPSIGDNKLVYGGRTR